MKLLNLALLLFLAFFSKVYAQNPYHLKGIVADSANNSKLHNATISILNAKDSTLYKFTRATTNGSFFITDMRKGNFIMLLTYPAYADYVFPFTLDSAKNSIDFKEINMKSKARLLNEVIIRGQGAAIKIKGDTTEFNAGSYAIQPNDKVEDLLKKLPGIQVDKDGKITAQGKTVPKVLVDGEEFFGDDPTLVTKNLRADMVDKVQLFEKTSDQAAFTGVDDGQKTQTINIKLKENMKKGYFGKVDAGYGTEDFYQGQAMFNAFKAKQKFSIYGTSSNNGKTGLGWNDAEKFGSGNNMEISGDAIYFTSGPDDIDGWEGQYYGEGIPRAHNGGAHYDNKWNNDKETINTNYKVGSLGVKGTKNTLDQNNLPSGIINTNSDENSDKYIFRQKLDAVYTLKLDTTSNLKISVDGTLKNNDNVSDYKSIGVRGDNSLINTSSRSVDNHGKEQLFNISAFYNKKLKKTGRNYSITLSQKFNQQNTNGFLKSDNRFYDEQEIETGSKIVDQYKTNDITTSVFNSNITYNEPITKSLTLALNYGFSLNSSRADKRSFNASTPGNYNDLDEEFSNDFKAIQYINQGGAIFNYKKGKTILTFGTKVSAVSFNQYEAISSQRYNRSFLNWLPQFTYQYKFTTQKSFRFSYNGNTTQPTVEQLQPVRVNTDEFNIPIGNPNLKPSYRNSFNMSYNSYKVLTNANLYLSGSINFTNNAIVNNITTDAQGRSLRQAVNLDSKTPVNYNIWSRYGRKVKFIGLDVSINFSANGNTSYNYVSTDKVSMALNKTTSQSYSPQLGINRYKDKLELYASFGPRYNAQESSLQKNITNKGWGTSGYGSFKIVLPKKFTIQADAEYTYTPSSQSFDNSFEQIIVNSSITKGFFKKEELKLMVRGNDLFNQNSGFNRFASANSITQTSYNNINRYFMFSLVWDFSKMGGVPTK